MLTSRLKLNIHGYPSYLISRGGNFRYHQEVIRHQNAATRKCTPRGRSNGK
jgi:hypothetical protein